jgi:hypothetical protein
MAEEQYTLIQDLGHQLQTVKPPQHIVLLMYTAAVTSSKPELQAAINKTFSSTFDAPPSPPFLTTSSLFCTVEAEAIEEVKEMLSALVRIGVENTI